MNNNKESDKTYIVAWCEHHKCSPNTITIDRYEVYNSYDDAVKKYEEQKNHSDCYSANITQVIESTDYHQTRAAKIVDEPKVTDDDGCLDSCSNNEGKCPHGYVCELHEDERNEPKKITNDFDHWIKELDTTAQNMADWLSNNTENFEEEYLIDNARTSVQEAVQSIQENKAKNVTALPTANCVTAVLDYILYSEMGGTYDATDSWHSTYQLLMELRNDKIDPDDLSYVSDLKPLH
jgi:hypothetical protein